MEVKRFAELPPEEKIAVLKEIINILEGKVGADVGRITLQELKEALIEGREQLYIDGILKVWFRNKRCGYKDRYEIERKSLNGVLVIMGHFEHPLGDECYLDETYYVVPFERFASFEIKYTTNDPQMESGHYIFEYDGYAEEWRRYFEPLKEDP